jgi:hypothetical protein
MAYMDNDKEQEINYECEDEYASDRKSIERKSVSDNRGEKKHRRQPVVDNRRENGQYGDNRCKDDEEEEESHYPTGGRTKSIQRKYEQNSQTRHSNGYEGYSVVNDSNESNTSDRTSGRGTILSNSTIIMRRVISPESSL